MYKQVKKMQKGLFNILDDAYCLLMQPADYLCVFI